MIPCFQIANDDDYEESINRIYNLMNKGEANLITAEISELTMMAKAVEEYEDEILKLKPIK